VLIRILVYTLAVMGAARLLVVLGKWSMWRFRESVRYAMADRLWKESNRVSAALTEHGRELGDLRCRVEELERAVTHHSDR
jgi:hypothetical protein